MREPTEVGRVGTMQARPPFTEQRPTSPEAADQARVRLRPVFAPYGVGAMHVARHF